MPPRTNAECFLLNHTGRDANGRFEITLWAKSSDGLPVKIVVNNFRPLFFVSRDTPAGLTESSVERKALPLKSMEGHDVDCLYFRTQGACLDAARTLRARGICVFESDIFPVERYLMERFIKGGFELTGEIHERGPMLRSVNPTVRGKETDIPLSVLSLDIETNAAAGTLYCIGCSGAVDACFMIGSGANEGVIRFCKDEADCIRQFLAFIAHEDPDIIIGWNVIDFDLWMLQQRCEALNIPFILGREGNAKIMESQRKGVGKIARVPGRVVMDVPFMLRAYYHTFEEYSLDFVAGELLGEHKTITLKGSEKIAEIDRLFAIDTAALARYNLDDTRLTRKIFDLAKVLPNAIERTKRSGHLLDRPGGSVAAFDFLYLPQLHRKGYVARDVVDVPPVQSPLSGGYVMDTTPGIYRNVLVFDFKSLYPTIIMTFLIDPLGHISPSVNRVQGPVGPSFATDETILPHILRELMEARGRAKRENNPYLSQAIKILMNSFYGVLGTPACRFFSWDLAQSITGTGQYIFKQTASFIENISGFRVIYGDTDSLFVLAGEGTDESGMTSIGNDLVAKVNVWMRSHLAETFGAESKLELEFEEHFVHFFMPPIRGTDIGSKKRYCGTTRAGEELKLHFKGLESARTDWTELARDFQHELYLRIFQAQPVKEYVTAIAADVRSGKLDPKLVYKKRLRKSLDEYTVNVPPHAQAARLLDEPKSVIAYYITREGPQPIEKLTSPLDYDHYVESQLKPIADSILGFVGLEFEKIVSGQQDLFG
jgi:DNA polymerase-2